LLKLLYPLFFSSILIVGVAAANFLTAANTATVFRVQIDPLGSWNNVVPCNSPWVVRISDITDNMTGTASFNNSLFSPGLTSPSPWNNPFHPKRWLTNGNGVINPPSGWSTAFPSGNPGPACTIRDQEGIIVAGFVEIDGVGTSSMVYESDCLTISNGVPTFDGINGGSSVPVGHYCDDTVNIFDPALVPHYGATTSCLSPTDPTCYGQMHLEFDHDWMAAGYCGITTATCNNSTLAGLVQPGSPSTLFDFQGFVYWDPEHVTSQTHSFSGWELHPLTAWRPHCTLPLAQCPP